MRQKILLRVAQWATARIIPPRQTSPKALYHLRRFKDLLKAR